MRRVYDSYLAEFIYIDTTFKYIFYVNNTLWIPSLSLIIKFTSCATFILCIYIFFMFTVYRCPFDKGLNTNLRTCVNLLVKTPTSFSVQYSTVLVEFSLSGGTHFISTLYFTVITQLTKKMLIGFEYAYVGTYFCLYNNIYTCLHFIYQNWTYLMWMLPYLLAG